MTLDPQTYAHLRIDTAKQSMAWKPGSTEEMHRWQDRLRAKLRRLCGGLDEPHRHISARITDVRELPQYRRESVQFESRPGLDLFGYFLTPRDCPPHRPAVLCLPGHGTGVDSLVGIKEDGAARPWGEWGDYQFDLALQCVAHGWPAFAIEQLSFGRRRDEEARRAGGGASSCTRDSMAALMLGETMTGWRVWDAMRAMDYMQTRLEVNPDRMCTMGISGGGLVSLFTAALDSRVFAAVVSGYFNTFRDSILSVNHCVDNYVPGILNLVEMPDLAALVAPRALFCEGGAQDPIFPIRAFNHAVARAREIYTAFGHPDRFDSEVFEGDHHFHGKGAFRFLERALA